MKYLTPEESLRYVAALEDQEFYLPHWEYLEKKASAGKLIADEGFDLMDFRDTLKKINKEFNIN